MKQPLVSIIITTYNRKNIVGKTIKSVLDQNYKNKEIIVVDDNSTDGTNLYFKNHWKRKIKYVKHKKNLGVQFASNTGYNHSKGKYLAFVGDDDIWSDANKLKRQVSIFEEDKDENIGIVTTSVRIISGKRKFNKVIKRPKDIIKHLMAKNGIIYGSAALIRRSAFVRAGMFDEELPKGTDSDVFRRIVLLGYDAYFLENVMIDYYEGPGRMSSRTIKNIRKSIFAQNYLFSKYTHLLNIYPKAKSYRLLLLGQDYLDLYIENETQNTLSVARRILIKSFLTYPFNLNSLILLARTIKL